MTYPQPPQYGRPVSPSGHPHPMPGAPPRSSVWSKILSGLAGAVITAVGAVVAAGIGKATNTFTVIVGSPPTMVQTVTVTPSPPSAGPSDAPGGSSPAMPSGVSVRRSTGSSPITLRPSYGVDLDDDTSLNWSVKSGPINSLAGYGSDVGSDAYESKLDFGEDYAVVSRLDGYSTCAEESGYTRGGIERGSLRQGEQICLRTGENRYAAIKIVSASATEIRLTATVWDPPVE